MFEHSTVAHPPTTPRFVVSRGERQTLLLLGGSILVLNVYLLLRFYLVRWKKINKFRILL